MGVRLEYDLFRSSGDIWALLWPGDRAKRWIFTRATNASCVRDRVPGHAQAEHRVLAQQQSPPERRLLPSGRGLHWAVPLQNPRTCGDRVRRDGKRVEVITSDYSAARPQSQGQRTPKLLARVRGHGDHPRNGLGRQRWHRCARPHAACRRTSLPSPQSAGAGRVVTGRLSFAQPASLEIEVAPASQR